MEEAEHRSRKKDLRRLPWLSCVDSASTAGGLGLIPGQGARAHILQLKKKPKTHMLHLGLGTAKRNKYLKEKDKKIWR